MGKNFWGTFGGQVAASLMPIILLLAVLWLAWRKVFGPGQTVSSVFNNTVDAAATIPGGLASLVGSALKGQTDATYITPAQQRAQAAAALAAKMAGG